MDATNWSLAAEVATAAATAVIAATGVLALRYAKGQLDGARKEAQTLHLAKLVEQFEGPPVSTARKGLAERRLISSKLRDLDIVNAPPEADEILNFFEHVSMLEENGMLDPKQVWSEFGYWMLNLYTDLKPLMQNYQEDDPTFYQNFEELIKKLVSIEAARGGSYEIPKRSDIEDFYAYELRILGSRQTAQ